MKKHILLVCGDTACLKMFDTAVRAVGDHVKCTPARNGIHAQQLLEHLTVDTIFLHLADQVMEGLDSVRAIKRHHNTHHIPIILFTNYMQYYQRLAKGFGADDSIDTPTNPGTLQAYIENRLARREPTHANTHTN